MHLNSFWTSVILLVIGASIGFVPNYLTERRKEKAQLRTRWDAVLHTQCSDFVASVRRLRHLASRLTKTAGDSPLADQLDDEHAQLRSLGEQVRLLGSKRLQDAVRLTIRHAYAVRRVAEGHVDKRAAEYPGVSPDERLVQALAEVSRAVREQLRVKDPEEVTIEPS